MTAEPTITSSKRTIVILGGSYGGVSTAHYLLKHVLPKLPNHDEYQVALISPSTQALCRPACPRALISDDMFPQDKLFVDILTAFTSYAKTNTFRFVQGTATSVNHDERTVTIALASDHGVETLTYHALVIATGASTPSPLLGLNRDSETLRQSWAEFRKALPKAKSIVIAGGGPAGVETAGELGEHLNGRAGWAKTKLENPRTSITLVTAASQILPALRPSIAQKAEEYLAQVGVTILKGVRVETVSPALAGVGQVAENAVITLDSGKTLEADLYIPATGTRPNTDFVDDSLLLRDRRVDTNPSTLRVDKAGARVYAIGDASSFARPAVHNILSAVPVLCFNIRRDLLLASERPEAAAAKDRLFAEDTRETQLVPIGRSKGVGAAMGYRLPSFGVWMIKGRDYWLWTTGSLWSGSQWVKES
ncbi:Putative FAD/NAD(P)-binding domain, FAD/NAD(P)-binding domain superfamily [Colletotrichum destructivum]|uniref:FAD/NAD(P)-binding domain, FAD/NAD(P)-binding domain superfamily n=1 Tax=Colletotrichum destructivum TaxID=34406 RepID=A0AAX4I0P4_9PEZI|nr:Putative FAD/NAD(P)-binding domain, FAD/NAD(P)-binding domain superfamily [Colletotrichum destructivum]